MRADLLDVFRSLVEGIHPWPLYLYGPPGCGKTSAILALTDHVQHAVYMTAALLAERHLADITGRGPKLNWDSLGRSCQLFVLDELGVREKVSDTAYEVTQKALDLREGMPLIVCSNLDLQRLAKVYDARIADRCAAGVQFELKGDSRRTA